MAKAAKLWTANFKRVMLTREELMDLLYEAGADQLSEDGALTAWRIANEVFADADEAREEDRLDQVMREQMAEDPDYWMETCE